MHAVSVFYESCKTRTSWVIKQNPKGKLLDFDNHYYKRAYMSIEYLYRKRYIRILLLVFLYFKTKIKYNNDSNDDYTDFRGK